MAETVNVYFKVWPTDVKICCPFLQYIAQERNTFKI
jgi:hypothetical protein